MGELTCIGDYRKAYGPNWGTCCRSVSPLSTSDPSGPDKRTEAESISRPSMAIMGIVSDGKRHARGRCGRMRHWQDAHLVGDVFKHARGKRLTAGPLVSARGGEMGARVFLNDARRSGLRIDGVRKRRFAPSNASRSE